MKTTIIILSILIVGVVILFFILGIMSKSGKAHGLIKGSLARCSIKPNCVCSEIKDDTKHYIEPIFIPQIITFDTLPILKNTIQEMGGIIQEEKDYYAAYYFSSAIFGFVDDLEIRFDPNQRVIHIRSASRVGYSDRGANKMRVEMLKKRFTKKIAEAKQIHAQPL